MLFITLDTILKMLEVCRRVRLYIFLLEYLFVVLKLKSVVLQTSARVTLLLGLIRCDLRRLTKLDLVRVQPTSLLLVQNEVP